GGTRRAELHNTSRGLVEVAADVHAAVPAAQRLSAPRRSAQGSPPPAGSVFHPSAWVGNCRLSRCRGFSQPGFLAVVATPRGPRQWAWS
ncbi:MAG: hypothetical protein ABWK05_02855, partial [Pyrobaculum sp.]